MKYLYGKVQRKPRTFIDNGEEISAFGRQGDGTLEINIEFFEGAVTFTSIPLSSLQNFGFNSVHREHHEVTG